MATFYAARPCTTDEGKKVPPRSHFRMAPPAVCGLTQLTAACTQNRDLLGAVESDGSLDIDASIAYIEYGFTDTIALAHFSNMHELSHIFSLEHLGKRLRGCCWYKKVAGALICLLDLLIGRCSVTFSD